MGLARQTAEGLADLVGKHLTLARLELKGDLEAAAGRARVIVVLALLAIVGYALTMAGVAIYLGGKHREGFALAAMGLVHLGVGAGGMFLGTRARATRLMNGTTEEVKRSLTALGSAGASTGVEEPRAP